MQIPNRFNGQEGVAMASIYRRGTTGIYQVSWIDENGLRRARSTRTTRRGHLLDQLATLATVPITAMTISHDVSQRRALSRPPVLLQQDAMPVQGLQVESDQSLRLLRCEGR